MPPVVVEVLVEPVVGPDRGIHHGLVGFWPEDDLPGGELLQELATWQIVLRPKPYETVVDAAIRAYNRFHEDLYYDRGHEYEPASRDSSPEFLQRITVNHLRHNLSNYEARLDALFGRVGKQEAYRILNAKIYERIAAEYPMLKEECERQLRRKNGEGE